MAWQSAVGNVVVDARDARRVGSEVLKHCCRPLLVFNNVSPEDDTTLEDSEMFCHLSELFATDRHQLADMNLNSVLFGASYQLVFLGDGADIPSVFALETFRLRPHCGPGLRV